METGTPIIDQQRLHQLVAEQDIRQIYMRYCRGIDRRQYELVRSCYHDDATDHHGDFYGGVDAFLEYVAAGLPTYERTMHFLGNIHIEVRGTQARGEAYAIAFHRVAPRGDKPERDHVVGLRYVDDFEQRDGVWRIAARVCVFDWTRTDPVKPGWVFKDPFLRGRADGNDIVFAPSLKGIS
jgi:hypothetical protein